jgi:hypothetical protein
VRTDSEVKLVNQAAILRSEGDPRSKVEINAATINEPSLRLPLRSRHAAGHLAGGIEDQRAAPANKCGWSFAIESGGVRTHSPVTSCTSACEAKSPWLVKYRWVLRLYP